MITITIGLIFFLIGIEFLFFTNRLQCDAENACKETNSWYSPISEWMKNPAHILPLRIIGGLSLIFSLYLLYIVE
jgi:amino acid transporter